MLTTVQRYCHFKLQYFTWSSGIFYLFKVPVGNFFQDVLNKTAVAGSGTGPFLNLNQFKKLNERYLYLHVYFSKSMFGF